MNDDREEAGMSHPSREDWVAYLYGEADARDRSSFTSHLRDCGECRQQVERGRATMHAMNAWEMAPVGKPRRASLPRWVPAAAAALIAFAVGLGAARLTAPEPVDVAALKEEMGQSLRQEIGTEWRNALAVTSERTYSDLYTQLRNDVDASTARAVALTRLEAGRAFGEFARVYEEDQTRGRLTVAELLQYVDDQRAHDVAELRLSLSTLASATGQEFERTKRRFEAITPIMRVIPAGALE